MKLETQLARTYHRIERMMEDGTDATKIRRFYLLIHRFERLNDRYIRETGHSYNPTNTLRGLDEFHVHD